MCTCCGGPPPPRLPRSPPKGAGEDRCWPCFLPFSALVCEHIVLLCEEQETVFTLTRRCVRPRATMLTSPRPSTHERYIATVAARDAAEASRRAAKLQLNLTHPSHPPPHQPPPTPPAPVLPPSAVMAVPPSMDDLMAVFELCGSRLAVVEFLANMWKVKESDIAATVYSWLVKLPSAPPPSRSRSAPPTLPRAVHERLSSAGAGVSLVHGTLRYADVPAATAPAHGADALAGTLSRLHSASTRLSAGATSDSGRDRGNAPSQAQIYTLSQPTFAPVRLTAAQVAAVPEDEAVAEWPPSNPEGDFMMRSGAMQSLSAVEAELAPALREGGAQVGSWRMRF
jgi:hypothetical protein